MDEPFLSVGYIAGDTRLDNVSAASMARQFAAQVRGYVNSEQLLRHAPFSQYFTDQNVAFICRSIEKVLEQLFPPERFRVPPNQDLANQMVLVAVNNCGLAGATGPTELNYLNRAVIEHESRVHYASVKNTFRYFKEILENDRMKTMPYAELSRGTRGENAVCSSGYALSHPWSLHRANYLHYAEGLAPCASQCGGFKRIPNYLLPQTWAAANASESTNE